MGPPSAISIHNDLAPGKSRVSLDNIGIGLVTLQPAHRSESYQMAGCDILCCRQSSWEG